MAPRPVAFVAGPYRSEEGRSGVERNIAVASEAAKELWRMGFAVICPHTNTALFDFDGKRPEPSVPDEAWLEGYLKILERCDLLVLLPGWEKSEGATAEALRALDLNMAHFTWNNPDDRQLLQTLLGWGAWTKDSPRAHFRTLLGEDLPARMVAASAELGRLMREAGDDVSLEQRKAKTAEMAGLCEATAEALTSFAELARFLVQAGDDNKEKQHG